VLARSIALHLGLADEYGGHLIGGRHGTGPNVQIMPSSKSREEKRAEMPQRWRELAALDPDFAGPYDGGGGWDKNRIRYAEHCLMRRRVGAAEVRTDESEFCAVCTFQLRSLFTGTQYAQPDSSQWIDDQQLKYHQNYGVTPEVDPPKKSFDLPEKPPSVEHYACTLEFGGDHGMRVINLRGLNLPHSSGTYEQPVMDAIEYRNLAVRVGGSWYDFPVREAAATATFTHAEGPGIDPMVQAGALYTMIAVVGSKNGKAKIRVELSLVLRGGAEDFDPAGAGRAMKLWPQIAFTALTDRQHRAPVDGFRGDVLYGGVRVPMPMQLAHAEGHHHHGGGAPSERNYVGLFTDSNSAPLAATELIRRIHGPSLKNELDQAYPVMTAIWHSVFDYVRTDIPRETTYTGVYSAYDAPYNSYRLAEFTWPTAAENVLWPIDFFPRHVAKMPRQGAYDNIHIHGDMGTYRSNPQMPMIMAPVCAHACFHLHWRWSPANYMIQLFNLFGDLFSATVAASSDPVKFVQEVMQAIESQEEETAVVIHVVPLFRDAADLVHALFYGSDYNGWSSELFTARSGVSLGAPLVPPNQRVRIALTADGSTATPSGRELQPDRKYVWYRTEILSPVWRDRRQVTHHPPAGLAYKHAPGPLANMLRALLALRYGDQKYLDGKKTTLDQVFNDAYEMMRFINMSALDLQQGNNLQTVFAGNQVIPEGTIAVNNRANTLESL
jgi:hypothetical protein